MRKLTSGYKLGKAVTRTSVPLTALFTVFLTLLVHIPAVAAVAGLITLPTSSSDGKAYSSVFTVAMTVSPNTIFTTSALTTDHVQIAGTLRPQAEHVGKKADIFVVEKIGNKFTMKNADGVYIPWNTQVNKLVPFVEGVTLSSALNVDVFKGALGTAGQHLIFLGYMLEGSTTLIYTPSAATLQIATNIDPFSFFEANIQTQIIQAKCILCHVSGGVADRQTTLLYTNKGDATRQNFDLFAAFFRSKPNALAYIQSKVSGGNGHVGGNQLAVGSTGYNQLTELMQLLAGSATVSTLPPSTGTGFFTGVKLLTQEQTLRRAAILLAGRLPVTATETNAVADVNAGTLTLRIFLRALMQGENFHNFIKNAANDRLLLRGAGNGSVLINACPTCFPGYTSAYTELEKISKAGKSGPLQEFNNRLRYSLLESPLELIAYVVENDKPYSEILTADYEMMTPVMSKALGGTASFDADASAMEFKPGKTQGYYRQDASVITTVDPQLSLRQITNPGNLQTNYPHSGLLNSLAFLVRYPTTATNRNRARARWTYLHFLGVDVEQLALRTTDPVALADTNNPTMNNGNCTVCHAMLDPVAGAFQDYGDQGFYKSRRPGLDSLDGVYVGLRTGALYKAGDTWYRDMRAPGFNQHIVPAAADSLRWLAQEIVKDPRFATATVKFWWPAVIGSDLLAKPEVVTDMDYFARLAAYEAQEATIASLAEKFSANGLKLKDLLVDLLLSDWFRASDVTPAQSSALLLDAHEIAGLGTEKLLTPEQLANKTKAVTGFNWGSSWNFATLQTGNFLTTSYSPYYGGIDSVNSTTRMREITPLMDAVALTHALEASCPIVLGEFILSDASRKLFGGIDEFVTPLTEISTLAVVTSATDATLMPFTLSTPLSVGTKKVSIGFINDFCDMDPVTKKCRTDRNLIVASVMIRKPDNTTININGNLAALSNTTCGSNLRTTQKLLSTTCVADFSFNADKAGTYVITANLSAQQSGKDSVMANIAIASAVDPLLATGSGAMLIKTKLVELHQKFLGKTFSITAPEIVGAYNLLVNSWNNHKTAAGKANVANTAEKCDWSLDMDYVATLGYPGVVRKLNESSTGVFSYSFDTSGINTWIDPLGADPLYMKQSWKVVIAYLLSHYNFLHE
jgi:Protein of unknown function (DUF1588)